MKTSMTLILALSVLAPPIFVGTSHVTYAATNPFSEGVGRARLSQADKADLLQYVDQSKVQLERALERGKGKSFSEANQIYLSSIKSVVMASFENKPRSELLMRMALNQALELTFGLPDESGSRSHLGGVLQGQGNPDLMTVVLEDSMRMAIAYAQDDRVAIQTGALDQLPYLKFAVDHLGMGRLWLASVLDPAVQYKFSVAVLQQTMNTLIADTQVHRTVIAEELVQLDALLESNPQEQSFEAADLMSQVRVLRSEMRKLLGSLNSKALNSHR